MKPSDWASQLWDRWTAEERKQWSDMPCRATRAKMIATKLPPMHGNSLNAVIREVERKAGLEKAVKELEALERRDEAPGKRKKRNALAQRVADNLWEGWTEEGGRRAWRTFTSRKERETRLERLAVLVGEHKRHLPEVVDALDEHAGLAPPEQPNAQSKPRWGAVRHQYAPDDDMGAF
jgi:hypothetical protein